AATRCGTRTARVATDRAAEQIRIAVGRTLAVRIGAALALNAARAAIDTGIAAARSGDVAGGAAGATDWSGRIAERAAQRSTQAAPEPAAAAEQLRRGGG